MRDLSRSETVGLLALLTLITVIVGVSVLRNAPPAVASGVLVREPPLRAALPARPVPAPFPISSPSAAASDTDAPVQVVVHVAGAVHKPGVYHLPPEARGEDALKAAGGPTGDANTDAINLAAHIEDGSQLYVPTRKEQPAGGASPEADSAPAAAPPVKTRAKSTASAGAVRKVGPRGSKSNKLTDPSQGKVDLNSASAEALQRLPGVGPAMAERLLEFRKENHGFHSVEDLLQVSGIGEKKFEKLRPFVTLH
jgi:competence protein ComEA